MPNALAHIVLFAWPLVVLVLFRRLPLQYALVWSVVAGFLLLPLRTGFDLPVLPAVDKNFMLSVCAALGCAWALRRPSPAHLPARPLPDFTVRRGQRLFLGLLGLLFAAPFITALSNTDPIFAGPRFLPGLRPYDAFSMGLGLAVALIPFLLGRRFLADETGQRTLLTVVVIAALGYSVLALYEVRMSPQLNRMVYGFFPHSFAQHIRGDGFRPLVFLPHGLWLAIFFASAVLSALALWRTGGARAGRWLAAGLWLLGVLALCKSLGAFALTLLFAPVLLLLGRRVQLLIAACVAGVVLLYPMMRGAGLVPVDRIYEAAASVNPHRAASFKTRLDNEDRLLAKAEQKPLAGWGSWGRNRVYDPESGRDITITDGYWIIVVSSYGWLGYIAQFGLLTLPLILMGLRAWRLTLSPVTAGTGVITAVLLIDQIPNATISPLIWLIAGSIIGRYQTALAAGEVARSAETPATEDSLTPSRAPVYRRAFQKTLSPGPRDATSGAYRREVTGR